MKKLFLLIFASFTITGVYGQVFNTGQTLKKGVFSLGIEPALHIDGGANGVILFGHAGYGLKSGLDAGIQLGFGEKNYFGANLEFALSNNISLGVGAHDFGYFGLDGTLNFAIPLRSDIHLYSGLDTDINFIEGTNSEGESETTMRVPFWIPIGIEVGLSRNTSLLFESEIALNDPAYHVIGGGLNFYL
jgi:hypothetical protein